MESGAGTIAPSWPLPTVECHSAATSVIPPRGTPKARPLKEQTRQDKKMAQMTEHFKAPEKIQLSKEEIANLSDAQFKTLVIIKMLIELVEFVRK